MAISALEGPAGSGTPEVSLHDAKRTRAAGADDPLWYKDAIIYELRTRSFFDSNGDGIGDLIGLAAKLDYIQDLGVTAIWLLPLCPSPGKDDGYDIADYMDVHPDIGTLQDLRHLAAQTVEVTFAGPAPELPPLAGVQVQRAGPNALRCEVSGGIGPLIQALAGHPVATLRSREPSLEEIFLHHYDGSHTGGAR